MKKEVLKEPIYVEEIVDIIRSGLSNEEIKEKLNDVCLTFKVKCSNDGKVFGSISSKQISDKLNELGYSIDKRDIKLNETLNTLGIYNVEVVIYKKVKGNIKVELKK